MPTEEDQANLPYSMATQTPTVELSGIVAMDPESKEAETIFGTTTSSHQATDPPASGPPQINPTKAPNVALNELYSDGLIPGYPKLAGRMGALPQIAMFRRFGALNARNLLYLQNDLAWLEQELRKQEEKDSLDNSGKKMKYAFNARWINTAHYCPKHDGKVRDGDRKQQELVMDMRKLLNEYSKKKPTIMYHLITH